VGLGQAAAIDGNYREALGFYLKALDALPKVNEAVFQKLRAGREFQIGTAYQGLAGEFPGEASRYLAAAEQAYRKAIELYPEYEDPRLNLAAILIGEGRLAEAIDQCTFVIQRNPQSVSAHINLGNAYYARHQFDAAMTAYRKALDLDPQNAGAMASIAAILAQSGHVDEAISLLHQALKIDPNNALARRNLAAAMAISAQTRP
jgi:tetratricopeptide (TPR) repeat protein